MCMHGSCRSVLLEEQAGTLADSSSHQNGMSLSLSTACMVVSVFYIDIELIPSPSSWFEMKALHSFEWIQR